jgi:hypothetical protein
VAGRRPLLPARVADSRWQVARVADLDEDGQTDILWRNRLTGDLLVWYMNGITMTRRALLDPRQFPETGWTVVPGPGADIPGAVNESRVER